MVIPSHSKRFSTFAYLHEAEDKTVNLELADLSESAEQTAEILTSNSSQLPKGGDMLQKQEEAVRNYFRNNYNPCRTCSFTIHGYR